MYVHKNKITKKNLKFNFLSDFQLYTLISCVSNIMDNFEALEFIARFFFILL